MLRFRRKYLLYAAVLISAPTIAFVHAVRTRHSDTSRPSLAQLAATNYRTLSVGESRKLLRYAQDEYRCLVSHAAPVSPPVASSTRITMRAAGRTAPELARLITICAADVGPPPRGASLQARSGQVLVYLPKRCLLNPSELSAGRQ